MRLATDFPEAPKNSPVLDAHRPQGLQKKEKK